MSEERWRQLGEAFDDAVACRGTVMLVSTESEDVWVAVCVPSTGPSRCE